MTETASAGCRVQGARCSETAMESCTYFAACLDYSNEEIFHVKNFAVGRKVVMGAAGVLPTATIVAILVA